MNLYTVTPREVRAMMDETQDPRLLGLLVRLEDAANTGDEYSRLEVIDEMFDVLVLQQGIGL